MIRKDVVITVLVIFCLTPTLFLVKSISSSYGPTYDPWCDINDDGRIDIKDMHYVAVLFSASGTPVNKTELLYNVSDTFTSLLKEIDSLNSSLSELQSQVNSLNATNLMPIIDSLNSSLLALQSQVSSINTTVTQLQSSDTSLGNSLSQLQSRADTLNNTMIFLNTTIVTMNTTITQLQTSDANLNSRMSALEAEVNALEANYSVTNLKLAPYAVPFNSTYSTTYGWTTEQYPNWADMPAMTVTLNLTRASQLIIMFSGELQNLGPDTTRENTWICIQAKINNDVALPSEFNTTTVDPSGTGMLTQGHYLRWGTYSCTFYSQTLNAGFYTIKLRWDCTVGKAEARSRDLVVIALPA